MKIKNKIILLISIITTIIIGITYAGSILAKSDLSELIGTGSSQIGTVYSLTYTNSLKGQKRAYCIQKDKGFNKERQYIVKDYVEINGKQATVYNSAGASGNIINNDLNAQIAYILNQDQGYGSHEQPTDAQNALWYISNDWTTLLFGNTYTWSGNATATRNHINDEAIAYANSVGDQKAPEMSSSEGSTSTVIAMTDKTNKDTLSVQNVGGYDRVGPFRWEFGGTLQSITVIGDSGNVSDSNVRFVKYAGTTPNIVTASQILTGEAFYVDVSCSAGISYLTGLTLKTSSSPSGQTSSSTVYTAKIWFLQSSATQNLIYVDIGNSPVNPSAGTGNGTYNISLSIGFGLKKVDDRDTSKPLKGVGFTFSATVETYDVIETIEHKTPIIENGVWQGEVTDWIQYKYKWTEHTMYLGENNTWSESPKTYYTDDAGVISINDIKYPTKTIINENYNGESYTTTARLKPGTNNITAKEVSNPYYGYTIDNTYSIPLSSQTEIANKTVTNHQKLVKLSGYVWLESGQGKTSSRDDKFDNGESGFNGITVYLKDAGGSVIKQTTTSELGIYSEINGGEYQFVDVNLDELQAGKYHVEFEYCGIDYQSVSPKLDQNNGSKAIDTNTRNILDSKFASVNGNGTQSLNINDVTVNYNGVSGHVSTVNNHTGCNVYAKTDEAGYNLYSGFTPTFEEIRYVNLGLFKKAQTDFALTQDLYNVRTEVNGFEHIYRYATVRYSNNGNNTDEDSSWNMGVKFQKNNGTYSRAIYKSDAEYEARNHRDNEIRVYVTYKIALKNESAYLGRVNNIVDYCDNRYTMISAGNSIDDKDNITENLNFGSKTEYNGEYSKYIIDTNSVLQSGETKYLYVQFEMNREAILNILNNGELLNNVAEVNSYTTFKDNNINTPVAVIDTDSVAGNTVPGNIDTYEDDTDAARSLQLELRNERAIVGTVFVDSTGKDNNIVYTNQERLGNGIFDNGETTLSGIKVKLHEIGKDDSSYDGERVEMETTTDENGNFEIVGYIPGNYILTYTWGDNTYKVQYYKGTIYDENRNKNNSYWYRGNENNDDIISVDNRKTDALDSSAIRENIDNEMEALKINTLESEINKAYNGGSEFIKTTTMDSSTPAMSFSVEYLTTITDGTVDQVRFTVRNVDFGIVERAKQQLEFSKRISGYKITLANGQVLVDAEITEDGQIKGQHKNTTYMGPTSTSGINTDGLLRTEMDNEMIEGATVEITYTMKVTNIGELDYISDRYYYYGNKEGSDKVRTSVTELLDYVDGRLSVLDDKWEEKDITYLNDVNARQKDNETYLNSTRKYLTSHLSKALAPTESNIVTLHTSKLLTSTDDNRFNNQAEITEVTKSEGFNTGTPVKVIWNEDKFYFNVDNSETTVIIPSTGEDKSYVLHTIIGMSSLLVLGVGIFVIKKFIIDNK